MKSTGLLIRLTTDCGLNWTQRPVIPDSLSHLKQFFQDIVIKGDGTGWMLGNDHMQMYLWKTENNGELWDYKGNLIPEWLIPSRRIEIIDADTMWLYDKPFGFSFDNREIWEWPYNTAGIVDTKKITGYSGYGLKYDAVVYFNLAKGLVDTLLSRRNSNSSSKFYTMSVIDDNIWVVTFGGEILHSMLPVTSVKEHVHLPEQYLLAQNYPNSFNASTTIKFTIVSTEAVTLKVYDVTGQEITNLASDTYPPGTHSITWDGRNSTGLPVSSGIYFYRISAGEFSQVRKMQLVK